MKILFVGGTWSNKPNNDGTPKGKPSKLVASCIDYIETKTEHAFTVYNGGDYNKLNKILDSANRYDIVFWWANVSNDLPKIRDVKEVASHVMLVTSKRNDGNKYNFMELVQRALAVKANLCFEFNKDENGNFNFMVFDPLGCCWYNGNNIVDAMEATMNRLTFLQSITRQSTVSAPESKQLFLSWYFDRFKQDEYQSEKTVEIPQEREFVKLVREYAEVFHSLMKPSGEVKRFLGNASLKPNPPQVGRCSKGMPSFKTDDFIFVSRRNVNKEFIELEHFVPTYLEYNKLYYCGDYKPSVDTPIQVRLYKSLPNIRYMIHSHCYIENAPFTTKSVPCGAIEEVEEVLEALNKHYGSLKENRYTINLLGHGSIVFGNSVDDLKNIHYIKRNLPEIITE